MIRSVYVCVFNYVAGEQPLSEISPILTTLVTGNVRFTKRDLQYSTVSTEEPGGNSPRIKETGVREMGTVRRGRSIRHCCGLYPSFVPLTLGTG